VRLRERERADLVGESEGAPLAEVGGRLTRAHCVVGSADAPQFPTLSFVSGVTPKAPTRGVPVRGVPRGTLAPWVVFRGRDTRVALVPLSAGARSPPPYRALPGRGTARHSVGKLAECRHSAGTRAECRHSAGARQVLSAGTGQVPVGTPSTLRRCVPCCAARMHMKHHTHALHRRQSPLTYHWPCLPPQHRAAQTRPPPYGKSPHTGGMPGAALTVPYSTVTVPSQAAMRQGRRSSRWNPPRDSRLRLHVTFRTDPASSSVRGGRLGVPPCGVPGVRPTGRPVLGVVQVVIEGAGGGKVRRRAAWQE